MSGPEQRATEREPARIVIEAARLAAHVERLIREGQTFDPFCEDCRQVAAELGVSIPRR